MTFDLAYRLTRAAGLGIIFAALLVALVTGCASTNNAASVDTRQHDHHEGNRPLILIGQTND